MADTTLKATAQQMKLADGASGPCMMPPWAGQSTFILLQQQQGLQRAMSKSSSILKCIIVGHHATAGAPQVGGL